MPRESRNKDRHAESAEGRMPYVGMLYNPPPAGWEGKRPDWQARYVCGLTSLDNLGLVMRAQARQVGFNAVDRWIGLTDGGNGLEEFLRKNFPPPKLQHFLPTLVMLTLCEPSQPVSTVSR